jgi:Uri superfamily endonuclease
MATTAGGTDAIADLPALPGAYLLLFDLTAPLALGPVGRLGEVCLPPALYAYAGSAKGPGGLAARISRHIVAAKRTHWHIDRLTCKAAPQTVFVWLDGDECALVRRLESDARARIPVAGFGSSDCRACAAHLVALPRDAGAALAERLARLDGGWFNPHPVPLRQVRKGSS